MIDRLYNVNLYTDRVLSRNESLERSNIMEVLALLYLYAVQIHKLRQLRDYLERTSPIMHSEIHKTRLTTQSHEFLFMRTAALMYFRFATI